MTRLTAVLALVALVASAPAGASRVVSGQPFPERLKTGETALDLCSASLLEKYFLDVYVAALYLGDCGVLPDALRDVPKRLEIAYLRGFSAEQFAKAANEILERSFDAETLAPLRDRIGRLNAAYRGVEKGDRYALTYRPGRGTELALNDEALVVVEGAEFARVYFAIWLGDEPADEGLRERLLRPGR